MSKRERPTNAKIEQLESDKRELENEVARLMAELAFRWSHAVARDVPAPEDGRTEGYVPHAYGSGKVLHKWSEPTRNGNLSDSPGTAASQGRITMYSTRLKALKQLRHLKCLECGLVLSEIDRQIAEEEQKV